MITKDINWAKSKSNCCQNNSLGKKERQCSLKLSTGQKEKTMITKAKNWAKSKINNYQSYHLGKRQQYLPTPSTGKKKSNDYQSYQLGKKKGNRG